MRSIWSGALSFGLINIPVKLYSATSGTGLDLDMLHKQDLSPIKYARICRSDGKEIPYDDIVKGYEYQPGDYVILTDEDFEKANVRKTKTVDIQEFTEENQIDSIFFEKPYYLEPEKGSVKAYVLLREVLKKSKKVGVAKFVLRNREHLGIIKPYKNALVLNQLRFENEIRSPQDLNIPGGKPSNEREVKMALNLIDQLSEPFNPDQYKDVYQAELKQVIKQKAHGKRIQPKGEEPIKTRAEDIMAMLKATLEEHDKSKSRVRQKSS